LGVKQTSTLIDPDTKRLIIGPPQQAEHQWATTQETTKSATTSRGCAASTKPATVEQFNARLAAKKSAWFWSTIGAALTSKHHWLVIVCDSCETIIDLDLTVKRRDPNAPICVALDDVLCPRCNGHGRTRVMALSRYPSI
jgi:hypothetical protein